MHALLILSINTFREDCPTTRDDNRVITSVFSQLSTQRPYKRLLMCAFYTKRSIYTTPFVCLSSAFKQAEGGQNYDESKCARVFDGEI